MSEGGHIPVLLRETVDGLAVKVGGRYVDGTLGRAGHTREILSRGGTVLGIDRDEQALREVAANLGDGVVGGRLTLAKGADVSFTNVVFEHGERLMVEAQAGSVVRVSGIADLGEIRLADVENLRLVGALYQLRQQVQQQVLLPRLVQRP